MATPAAFDVENTAEPGSSRSGCFPMEPFRCLPPALLAFIPGTWQHIQDTTHFVLCAGVICMFGTVILAVKSLVNVFESEGFSELVVTIVKDTMVILFILPSAFYSLKIIGQFDARLQQKQLRANKLKEELAENYEKSLQDMEGMLRKSAEDSAGLAERNFESKRRDFLRFLEHSKVKFEKVYATAKKDELKRLTEQFKRFCINWLNVFAECSIQPDKMPKIIAKEEEINACMTVGDVTDLLIERLRVAEVKFISAERDKENKALTKQRAVLDMVKTKSHKVKPQSSNSGLDALRSDGTGQAPVDDDTGHWLSCGGGKGCGCECGDKESGEPFPKKCRCICVRAKILSPEHMKLFVGTFAGIPIILMELVDINIAGLIMVIIAELCFVLMLIRFEELDIIQQLEREVTKLEHDAAEVARQNEEMKEFWTDVQSLSSLWLYRTVPRLELWKEVHARLEDSGNDEFLGHLACANHNLQALQDAMGPLSVWQHDSSLDEDDKKHFQAKLVEITSAEQFEDVLYKVDELAENRKNFPTYLASERAASSNALRPLVLTIVSASNLRNVDRVGQSDPYCVCRIQGKKDSFRTRAIDDEPNPTWKHSGKLDDFAVGDELSFEVWDMDKRGTDTVLGTATYKTDDILGKDVEVELELKDPTKPDESSPQRLKIKVFGSAFETVLPPDTSQIEDVSRNVGQAVGGSVGAAVLGGTANAMNAVGTATVDTTKALLVDAPMSAATGMMGFGKSLFNNNNNKK